MNGNKSVQSGWIVAVFMYGVLGFMGYMTWTAVFNVTQGIPNVNPALLAWLSLFLFDGGAYAGYRMLTGDAGGSHQREAAKTILWVDFLLATGMIAGALDILPAHWVRLVMLLSAAFNAGFLYYYKTHSPNFMEQSQAQDEQDAIVDAARRNRQKLHRESMRQADLNIEKQAIPMGALMALRAQALLKNSMRLPMTPDELKAFQDEVIDADAIPVPAALPAPAPQSLGLVEFLKTFFTNARRTTRSGSRSQQDAPSNSSQDDNNPSI